MLREKCIQFAVYCLLFDFRFVLFYLYILYSMNRIIQQLACENEIVSTYMSEWGKNHSAATAAYSNNNNEIRLRLPTHLTPLSVDINPAKCHLLNACISQSRNWPADLHIR